MRPSPALLSYLVTYELIDRVPTFAEHRALAEAVGWSDVFRWEVMEASIAGSICGTVAVESEGKVIGMGRVVGDGAFYFYVQDVAVHPDYRRQGLGRAILERLTAQIAKIAGGDCFVGLFASDMAAEMYRQQGFSDYGQPGDPNGNIGMWKVLRPAPAF